MEKQIVFCNHNMLNSNPESMNERTDSPTYSHQALGMVFVSACITLRELHSIDTTSAFLQGNDIEREVFLASIRNNERRKDLAVAKMHLWVK